MDRDNFVSSLLFPPISTSSSNLGHSDNPLTASLSFLDSDATLKSLLPFPSRFDSPTAITPLGSSTVTPPTFSLFARNFTQLCENSSNTASQLILSQPRSKIPKMETYPGELTRSLDFFASNSLPGLQSLESPSSFGSLFTKTRTNSQTLNSVIESCDLHSNPSQITCRTSVTKQGNRHNMGDKFRALQKLMPCDRKMDNATILGEAHKYIKFLQTQVKVLKTMPCIDSTDYNNAVNALGSVFGAMGMLTRQQLLQVLLNTRQAQTMLYSQDCCVFSIEQLADLENVSALRSQYI